MIDPKDYNPDGSVYVHDLDEDYEDYEEDE